MYGFSENRPCNLTEESIVTDSNYAMKQINREFEFFHRQVTNDVFVLPNKQFYFGCSYDFTVSNFVVILSTVKHQILPYFDFHTEIVNE